MAVFLKELCEGAALNVATVRILDVAAGTGLVGVELAKLGFKNIDALDYSQEMLDLAKEKGPIRQNYKTKYHNVLLPGCYQNYICAPFGNTIPDGMKARSYDCVIMLGGFAAGHLPLSR